MTYFQIGSDFETSERVGAGGMHQINHLVLVDAETGDEEDVLDRVDVGIHFHNGDEQRKKEYLSKVFNIPVEEIELEYIDEGWDD